MGHAPPCYEHAPSSAGARAAVLRTRPLIRAPVAANQYLARTPHQYLAPTPLPAPLRPARCDDSCRSQKKRPRSGVGGLPRRVAVTRARATRGPWSCVGVWSCERPGAPAGVECTA
eukprot:6848179-Prymnesium_polylepis.1